MSIIITREHNDPWARYVRACAKVANCELNSNEKIAAEKYAAACFKAYQLSSSFMMPVRQGVSNG